MKQIGLVGYGRVAPYHIAVLRALGAEVVAAVNRSPDNRAKAHSEGGIARTYASTPQMLDAESLDGIVCCPTFTNVGDAMRVIIPSGLPTLVEKPPGATHAELIALKTLVAEHGTPVMVGMNRRHYSVIRQAIEDAGGLDAITDVSVQWSEDPAHLAGRFDAAQIERAIVGCSLHGIDLCTWLAGPVAEPNLVTRNRGGFRWQMGYSGTSERGAVCSFQSTWDAPARWRLVFTSQGRQYTFAPLESCSVLESVRGPARSIEPDEHDQNFKPGFYRQAQVFLQMVDDRVAPQAFDLASVEPSVRVAQEMTDRLMATGPGSSG